MSIWADIQDRASGEVTRKEDQVKEENLWGSWTPEAEVIKEKIFRSWDDNDDWNDLDEQINNNLGKYYQTGVDKYKVYTSNPWKLWKNWK